MANLLGISGNVFEVSVFGSMYKSHIVKRHLNHKLFAIEPLAHILDPIYPPEVGALEIARSGLY